MHRIPSGFRIVLCIVPLFLLSCPSGQALSNPRDSLLEHDAHLLEEAFLRNLLVQRAADFVGARYRYGGMDPETGFDCSGLIAYVTGQYGLPLPRSSRAQAETGTSITLEETQPGDLIFFRRRASRPVSHVAMVVARSPESLLIIHSTSRGVVVDNLYESNYWRPKVCGARRVFASSASSNDHLDLARALTILPLLQ